MMKNVGDNKVISLFNYGLQAISSRYPETESRNIMVILFEHLFQFNRTDIVLKADELLTESEMLEVHFAVKELKKGKPIQYIVGNTEFYSLPFEVNEKVLIPRPETEELVAWILDVFKENKKISILDIGTGSGCIPIALKKNLPDAEIFACDISEDAIDVCKMNANLNNVIVNTFCCNILEDSPSLQQLDVIVSNPPYIPESDKEQMEDNVLEFEPHLALFVSNKDPLIFYRTIAEKALSMLKDGGRIFFEIHKDLSRDVGEILFNLEYSNIEVKKDISGNDRMVMAEFQSTVQ